MQVDESDSDMSAVDSRRLDRPVEIGRRPQARDAPSKTIAARGAHGSAARGRKRSSALPEIKLCSGVRNVAEALVRLGLGEL
jgi:hypothetical protein